MTKPEPERSPGRRLGVWTLAAYCLFVVVMAFPTHEGPALARRVFEPPRAVLDDYGINPWHFVFPGLRGINKRRNIAIRVSGVTRDGERVLLHEAPPGLTAAPVRVFDNVRTTVSMKSFSLFLLGQVMLAKDDEVWSEAMDKLRSHKPTRRTVAGFCTSATLNGGLDLKKVEFDIFTAGISYDTGEQYGRATHLLRAECKGDSAAVHRWRGPAKDPPDWPGVEWKELP